MSQLRFPLNLFEIEEGTYMGTSREKLMTLLEEDLSFHSYSSRYCTHRLHAFAAKFPPQLPRKFLNVLVGPDEVVLDPMMGSGTTIVEAFLADRQAIGFDIDPLALLLCKAKVTPLEISETGATGGLVLSRAREALQTQSAQLVDERNSRFDAKTSKFLDYWFDPQTQLELLALVREIEKIAEPSIRTFLEVVFSAIIITKSGGVSLARDLAHTRPHKVKDKPLRSALDAFQKRLQKNLKSVAELPWRLHPGVDLRFGDSQDLPLAENTVDLIVTSPPYAANAIDYMRAHKFSLVWLGYSINTLSERRKAYIGGEATNHFAFEPLPPQTKELVSHITSHDKKKGRVLHRYYSEMTRSLREMWRVLKPGKAAIVVVGTSTMRGINTYTHNCLAEIGQAIGFDLVRIGIRKLDRNRRMMPARHGKKSKSQIEQRMHEEYVIGFYKPS